jgi:hypothetical protein
LFKKYAKNLNQNDRGFFEASSSIKTSSIAFFIFGAKDNNISTSDCSLVPRGFQVEDDNFSYSLDQTRNLMLSPLVSMSTFKALAPSLGSLFFYPTENNFSFYSLLSITPNPNISSR